MAELEILKDITRLIADREQIDTLPTADDTQHKDALFLYVKLDNVGILQDAINTWIGDGGRATIWAAFHEWLETRRTAIASDIDKQKTELKAAWEKETP